MFLCEKKIVYLALFQEEKKLKAAGFARISGQEDKYTAGIYIKNAGEKITGKYPVRLILDEGEVFLGNVTLNGGNGTYERALYLRQDKVLIGAQSFSMEALYGVRILIDGDRRIEGAWRKERAGKPQKVEQEPLSEQGGKTKQESVKEKESPPERESLEEEKPEEEKPESQLQMQEIFFGDKWEQLQKRYKNVHPFGDDREYIMIEPRDFVILNSACQKLVNNSFLLHGFYNYRHMILGKDKEIGNEYESCFYLGVPGVFFEREKMVAVMFGFEGFECEGPVETGKFGYYLRKVEI